MSTPQQPFSFDIYPGLDAELEAAYARNVEQGEAEPGTVATSGIAAVVAESLHQADPYRRLELGETVREWAESELEGPEGALASWQKYDSIFLPRPPQTIEELAAVHPNLDTKLSVLHNAKEDLNWNWESTPEGTATGETMHLVLVPWDALRGLLSPDGVGLQTLLRQIRGEQGISQEDYINSDLLEAIGQNKPIYRDPDGARHMLSASEYLDKKIAEDGPWGVILAQTSNEAGIRDLIGQSPGELIAGLQPARTRADGMGIFEWWALTMQENPRELSNADYSWLLANRIELNGDSCVPYGDFSDGQVSSRLYGADNRRDDMRPRLAVIV